MRELHSRASSTIQKMSHQAEIVTSFAAKAQTRVFIFESSFISLPLPDFPPLTSICAVDALNLSNGGCCHLLMSPAGNVRTRSLEMSPQSRDSNISI